jgi:glycosyltransferase involved in cell wall biosynthesis
MNILYVANARIPTEKAHGAAIMHACDAFVEAGAQVELAIARRVNPIRVDAHEFYSVEKRFRIRRLPTLDLFFAHDVVGSIVFYIQAVSFYISLFCWAVFRDRMSIVYTRDAPALMLSYLGFKVFFECHSIPKKRDGFFRMLQQAEGIVVISQALKQALIEGGIAEGDIIVEPSGVNLATFDLAVSQHDARARLDIPQSARLLVYTGNFMTFRQDKGIADILQALTKLDQTISFYAVGGSPAECAYYEHLAAELGVSARTRFIGHRDQSELALYQRAADVLLMPFPDLPHYRNHMSPIKMFEYAASHRPIIASDLPTIREVLDEQCAMIVPPGNPSAIADAARALMADTQGAERLAKEAYERVALPHTWRARARHIVSFLAK